MAELDAATAAWARDGLGDLASLPDPLRAIGEAERLQNVAVLQAVTSPKPLRKAAAAALHRLRSRGVKVEDRPAPRVASLAPEEVDVPPRALLTFPDREGEVELLLAYTDRLGTRVLTLTLYGPGDVWNSRCDAWGRAEVRNVFAARARREGTEVPFVAGLRLAREWAPEDHEVGVFFEDLDPALVAVADEADLAALRPPESGRALDGAPWIFSVGTVAGDWFDEAVEALAERFTEKAHELEESAEGADPAAALTALVDEAIASAAGKVPAPTRSRLAEVARWAAEVRRWHGMGPAAERLEALAPRLESDAPAGEIPELLSVVRRAMIVALMDALRQTEDGDEDDEDQDDALVEEE